MPSSALQIVLIAVVLGGSLSAAEAPPLPAHPRLLFNAAGIEQLRQRIRQPPWTKVWASHLASLEKQIKREVELPPRGGNWSHNYVCPTHGARLERGRRIGPWHWEYKCSVGPHVLRGDPRQAELDFDGCAMMSVHGHYSSLVRDLGVAYQVTGDRRYAEHARTILLAYARRYLSYPLHNNQGKLVEKGGARVASQSLTEASWLTPMVQGADLVWDTFDASQREMLTEKLFRPAIEETILNRSKKPTVHNIQCHRNSAVGLVGFLLDDRRLIHEAIDGLHGYRANMAGGVQPDGMWFEGAWGYHFFTILGTWPLVEAAKNCGIDLYGPDFRKLFDAPLRLATPDFRLPAFNDSGEVTIGRQAELYELAYARYHDATYAALLARSKRTGNMALWFGVPTIAAGRLPQSQSRNAEGSGYAILQQGDGAQATWLCLKYGPHGGGHGHFDKNHFVLYGQGAVLMPDSGTHAYASPLHRDWDKTSFAHNTLVVDQATQDKSTGKCLCFGSASGADYAMTDAGPIYPNVRFVRTAAMLSPELVLFVDHVQADKPRTLDLVCHHHGRWENLPAGQPFVLPDAPGFKCLRDATTRAATAGWMLTLKHQDGPTSRIILAGDTPTEVITGTGVGRTTEDRVPLAVFRRLAKETVYVWAVSLMESPVTLSLVPGGTPATTVSVKTATDTWRVTADAQAGSVKLLKP